MAAALLAACGTAHAQTTVSNTTYGSGQTATVVGPQTVTTSGTVTVSSGANVRFLATSSVTLNAGFSCSGSTFQAATDTVPPTVPTGFSLSNDTNTSFTLNWAASTDPMVPVTSYQISYNGTTLGTFSSNSANINSVPPNNTALTASTAYTFAVQATDALGNTSAWSIPYVAITTPFAAFLPPSLNNSTVGIDPATVILSAAAGGTSGTITKVEFYNGATLVGTTTTNTGQTYPYQVSWTPVHWGTYTITAKAYDSLGEIAVTAPAIIKVDAPPFVSLTAPTNNTLVTPPASVTLAASATDSNDTITKVDFYQGTTLIGTATSAPYQYNWTNVPGGSYALTAVATNSFGATTTSSPVTLIVDLPPVVSLTSPANSSTFTVPATITLAASASSPANSIAKVDFYDGANLVHTVTSAPYQYTWNYVATGSHTLTARATDNYGATTTSSPVSVTVNTLRQSGGTAGLGNTLPAAWTTLSGGDSSRANVAVGITTGSLSVDKSGAATYTIPLYACPGTAGMEPKLSLSYSSSAGAGLLGYGWSLSGTSVITRGAQSAEVDGNGSAVDGNGHVNYVHGMSFATTDRYYLDGQRLIAINGETDGANNTEYRTETDSFSRIVSYGSNGNGPAYFKVWTKAGLIMEYGNTTDSALTPQSPGGNTLSWSVDKISDTVGNYMSFTYSNNPATGEQFLTEIDYTGNATTGMQPYNSIRFSYTTRQDPSSGFVYGATLSRTQIMTDIEAYNRNNLVRHYVMDYINRPSTNRSILADIKEIGSDGKAYPPLTFTYSNPSAGWDQSKSSIWAPPVPLAVASGTPQGTGFIDLTGNGRPDLVLNGPGGRNTWLNTTSGWVVADGSVPGVPDWRLPPGLLLAYNYGLCLTRFVDLNGAGRPSVVDANSGTTYLNTGSGWAQANDWTIPQPSSVSSSGGTYNRTYINFVDLNGDGLPDCVTGGTLEVPNQDGGTDQSNIDEAWINLGPNKIDPTTGTHWQWAPEYASGGQNVVFMDLNGDGLPDVVENTEIYGGGSLLGVSLNTGSSFNTLWPGSADYSRYVLPVPLNMNQGVNVPVGTEAVDLNGDGLVDLISWDLGNRSPHATYFNTGHGWVQDPGPYVAPYQMWDTGQSAPTGVALLDINGNGLPDFIVHYGDQTAEAWLNTGSDWSQQVSVDYVPPRAISHPVTVGHLTGADFVDINGTGVLDEVWNYNNDTTGYAHNQRVNVDRLTQVTTGMGVSATISYKPLTDPSVYTKGTGATYPEQDVISATYVVSEVDNDDGVGGQYAMTYTYAGLRSNVIHGNEGFASMTVTDGRTGINTVTDFRQDFPYIGMPSYSATIQSNGTILTASTTTYADQGSYANVHFPYANQVVQQSYELNGSYVSGTSTTATYDNYGNALTLDVQSLDANGSPTGYEKDTTSIYSNDTTNWFLGRLSRASVTSYAPGVPAITRTSAFTYYSDSGLLYTEVIEPDDTSTTDPQKLTTTYTYDAFGNKTSATTSGMGMANRMVATAYDSLGQFPVSTTNALGHQETYIYSPAWGVMTSQTGPNGLTTTWGYDGMGRKIQENRPDGTTTNINYRWAGAGVPPAPSGSAPITYLIETEASGAPPALVFYDSMGRAIYAFGLNGGDFDGNLQIVGGQTKYDNVSRAYWTSLPFYYGNTPQTASQVTAYDKLNRPLTQINADEEVSGGFVTTTFEYDGLVTKTTNPAGQVAITTKNSQGQVLSVITNANANAATERGETDYTYDSVGNILTTTVVNSNGSSATTGFLYDLTGRKTQMTDPDMGTWHYFYDAAGEIISQTDAKGQTTTMAYDQLGRLVTRTEAEGTTTWNYDSAQYGIGKPASVTVVSTTAANNYSESYTYDALGRPSVTTRNIYTGSTTETFTLGQQYDIFGRPTITTYPYGYQVKNVYNAFGFLKEVRQASATTTFTNDTTQNQLFWQADSYSIWGGINGISYGNGVTEDTVVAATTGRIQGFGIGYDSGNTVASYGYWHDSLGNLVTRNDDTTGRRESYTYDGLDRLTSTALTVSPGGLGTSSTVTVGYDSLGNITNKSDVGAYTYGNNAGPHAVTAAGGNNYQYDADGNMVAGSVLVSGLPVARTLAWTSFNQVKNITQGGHYSTFAFDAGHQRVTQTTDRGTTVYVGSALERFTDTSGNQTLKFYIFTPAGRSVVRTFAGGTVTTRYLHQDALGSIVAVTDENGNVTERYAYDPWGKQTALGPQPSTLNAQPAATTRGFTDHEMLSDLGLIHMNGRVYDPVLGRFLSADSVVQDPSDSQAYNRYSYCSNNPVNAIDPSGHSWLSNALGVAAFGLFANKHFRQEYGGQVLGYAAYAIVLYYTGDPQLAGAVGGFVSGFSGSLLNGGSIGDAFRNGVIGGAEGFALAYVGGQAGLGYVGTAAADGVIGGAADAAEGGQFRNGFYSGLVAGAGGEAIQAGGGDYYTQLTESAVVGGTASVIGGGKFANGAATAAFSYMATNFQQTKQEVGSLGNSASNTSSDTNSGKDVIRLPPLYVYATSWSTLAFFMDLAAYRAGYLPKAPLLPQELRTQGILNGMYTSTVGAASVVAGFYALTPEGRPLRLFGATFGVAGVVNGVPQFFFGIAKIIQSAQGDIQSLDMPQSNGDVLAIGFHSKLAGVIYDLGTAGNPIKMPENAAEAIGQVDYAKTVLDSMHQQEK
jgi:RHS repeat-associated protein